MRKAQRIDAISNLLAAAGIMTVSELAASLDVTEATIRRDLKVLELQKSISRSYGAARIIDSDRHRYGMTYSDEQRALARTAADLIQTGHMIILHGGKINQIIAAELVNRSRVTVITNLPAIFDIVRDHREIDLITIGGLYSRAGNCLYGHLAESSLNELRADMVFFEPIGIDFMEGFTHNNVVEIPILKIMSRTARSVILTVCADAFNNPSGALVDRLETVSTIVAYKNSITEQNLNRISESGIKPVFADCREGEQH